MRARRTMPMGAEPLPGGGVGFRVWAPERERVAVVLEGASAEAELSVEADGWFSGTIAEAGPGTLYRYRLDGGDAFPDPASRFQPDGPHGPSEVVDPATFAWSDAEWRGVRREGQVVYEMHVGTFTPEGTWAAAGERLPELAELGVTLLEVMPVADFPGRFGWGYDGVDLFAPTRLYGRPDDFRAFVDRAHGAGLGVVLDVVYNHLGPDGNYLREFSRHYFSQRYETEWGEALNFDGPHSGPVRAFVTANAAYWVREHHVDGLRIDATQSLFDAGPVHVLAEITRAAREAAGERSVVVIGENEPQEARLVRAPEDGGMGLDALWNDDFHHSAMVALTGRSEAYYGDHRGAPQELVSAAKWGWLFQGQRYRWQGKRRGTPALDLPAAAHVHYLQNHDQVANSGGGERLHRLADPARVRAATALLLLGPATPMLFQGQEFAASTPFLYFADHTPELAEKVAEGRRAFLAQFPSLADPAAAARLPGPADEETFLRCKLDHAERATNAGALALHRDLLRLRRDVPAFAAQDRARLHGAVLGPEAFLLRYLHPAGDRLLLVNLGADLRLDVAPEPLLAPPEGWGWHVSWSSEDPAYGGRGTPPVETDEGWVLPGHAAVVLAGE